MTPATRSIRPEPANGSPVCAVVAPGTGESVGGVEDPEAEETCGGGGGGEPLAALDFAVTVRVTGFVGHVRVVQVGVPSLVKVATLVILSPVVSLELTVTAKLGETALAVPWPTTSVFHVSVPAVSVTRQPGAPPHDADPGT